jgi:RNA polymerase sigma-70 factor (ECF subfamily)
MPKSTVTIALSVEAFNGIVARFQGALVPFVRSLISNGEDARDLVQDVFVDAWRATQRQTPPFIVGMDESEVRRWLFHAAYCNAISMLRRRGMINWESLSLRNEVNVTDSTGPAGFEERIVEGAALQAALETLEIADLTCLRLKIVDGFTTIEVAQILETTPTAARKRLSRAMQRVRATYFTQEGARGSEHTHE